MYKITLEDLEEDLAEILPADFKVKSTSKGIVIYTNLKENEYGELVPLDEEDIDYDEEEPSLEEDGIDGLDGMEDLEDD